MRQWPFLILMKRHWVQLNNTDGRTKMNAVQPFLISAFVLSWIVGLVWILTYIRQLKKRYPELHAVIFRDPFQKKIRNDWRLFMFLAAAKYRGDVDQRFMRQSDFLRFYIFAFFALMIFTAFTLITP